MHHPDSSYHGSSPSHSLHRCSNSEDNDERMKYPDDVCSSFRNLQPNQYAIPFDFSKKSQNDRVQQQQKRQPFETSRNLLMQHCYDEPNETDRHGINNNKPKQINLSSISLEKTYWDRENSPIYMETYAALPEPHIYQDTNFLFGKFNATPPTLDQGYHTLISPCSNSTTWSDKYLQKGKSKMKNSTILNNFFDNLSDDVMIRIFAFLCSKDLSSCARVCKRFNVLVWTPCLWKFIRISGENTSGDRALKRIFKRIGCETENGAYCPGVEKIHITEGTKLTDKGLFLIARKCVDLAYLQIVGCGNITNSALFDVVSKCRHLNHLDVTGCSKISCISVNNVDPHIRLQVQYIDFTDCPYVNDNELRIVICHCPQLTFLYLRRCNQITDMGLKFIPSFCSNMKELSVSDCVNVTDFGLYELAKLGPTLRYLSVAKCSQVSDAGLKVIAKKCYKLRYLNARGCEAVSDDAIITIARSCTRLRALDIGKCDVSDVGLEALAQSCPNLKKISLRNCDLITDRGVQSLAYFCRGLQQLNIQDCQISLEGYRAVKKYCKRCIIEHTNPGFF